MRLHVVPDGWAAHHRPVVAGFFKDRLRLERVSGKSEDELGTRTKVWAPIYEGQGLVSLPAKTAADVDSAGLPRTIASYVGRMPIEVIPQVGDRVTVLESDDPKMVGQQFMVEYDETQDLAADRTVRLTRTAGGV